jgi:hypothetical protein
MPIFWRGTEISGMSERRVRKFRKFKSSHIASVFGKKFLTRAQLDTLQQYDPLHIVATGMDKGCFRCGAKEYETTRKDKYGNIITIPPIDLGVENGKIFGALCHNCGWSF